LREELDKREFHSDDKFHGDDGLKGLVDFDGFPAMIAGMKKSGIKSSVIKIDPEIMSGTPCFAGTRVPVRTLLDYIEGGETLDYFLEGFPSVSREQVIAYLEEAGELMLATA
jgi:uncharacterized protein (DUF433 family)